MPTRFLITPLAPYDAADPTFTQPVLPTPAPTAPPTPQGPAEPERQPRQQQPPSPAADVPETPRPAPEAPALKQDATPTTPTRTRRQRLVEEEAGIAKPFHQLKHVLDSPDILPFALASPFNAISKFTNALGDVIQGKPVDTSDAWIIPDETIRRLSPARHLHDEWEVTPADEAAADLGNVIGAEATGFLTGAGILHWVRRLSMAKHVANAVRGTKAARRLARAHRTNTGVRQLLGAGRATGQVTGGTALATLFMDYERESGNLSNFLELGPRFVGEKFLGGSFSDFRLPLRIDETDNYLEKFGKSFIAEGIAAPLAAMGLGALVPPLRRAMFDGGVTWLDDLAAIEPEPYRYRGTDSDDPWIDRGVFNFGEGPPPQWWSRTVAGAIGDVASPFVGRGAGIPPPDTALGGVPAPARAAAREGIGGGLGRGFSPSPSSNLMRRDPRAWDPTGGQGPPPVWTAIGDPTEGLPLRPELQLPDPWTTPPISQTVVVAPRRQLQAGGPRLLPPPQRQIQGSSLAGALPPVPPDPWETPRLSGADQPAQLSPWPGGMPQLPSWEAKADPSRAMQYGSAIERALSENLQFRQIGSQRRRLEDMGIVDVTYNQAGQREIQWAIEPTISAEFQQLSMERGRLLAQLPSAEIERLSRQREDLLAQIPGTDKANARQIQEEINQIDLRLEELSIETDSNLVLQQLDSIDQRLRNLPEISERFVERPPTERPRYEPGGDLYQPGGPLTTIDPRPEIDTYLAALDELSDAQLREVYSRVSRELWEEAKVNELQAAQDRVNDLTQRLADLEARQQAGELTPSGAKGQLTRVQNELADAKQQLNLAQMSMAQPEGRVGDQLDLMVWQQSDLSLEPTVAVVFQPPTPREFLSWNTPEGYRGALERMDRDAVRRLAMPEVNPEVAAMVRARTGKRAWASKKADIIDVLVEYSERRNMYYPIVRDRVNRRLSDKEQVILRSLGDELQLRNRPIVERTNDAIDAAREQIDTLNKRLDFIKLQRDMGEITPEEAQAQIRRITQRVDTTQIWIERRQDLGYKQQGAVTRELQAELAEVVRAQTGRSLDDASREQIFDAQAALLESKGYDLTPPTRDAALKFFDGRTLQETLMQRRRDRDALRLAQQDVEALPIKLANVAARLEAGEIKPSTAKGQTTKLNKELAAAEQRLAELQDELADKGTWRDELINALITYAEEGGQFARERARVGIDEQFLGALDFFDESTLQQTAAQRRRDLDALRKVEARTAAQLEAGEITAEEAVALTDEARRAFDSERDTWQTKMLDAVLTYAENTGTQLKRVIEQGELRYTREVPGFEGTDLARARAPVDLEAQLAGSPVELPEGLTRQRREEIKAEILRRAITNGEVQTWKTAIPERQPTPRFFEQGSFIDALLSDTTGRAAQGFSDYNPNWRFWGQPDLSFRNELAIADEFRLRMEYNLRDAQMQQAQKRAWMTAHRWEELSWEEQKAMGLMGRGSFAMKSSDLVEPSLVVEPSRPSFIDPRFTQGGREAIYDPQINWASDLPQTSAELDPMRGAYRNPPGTSAGDTPLFQPGLQPRPESAPDRGRYRNPLGPVADDPSAFNPELEPRPARDPSMGFYDSASVQAHMEPNVGGGQRLTKEMVSVEGEMQVHDVTAKTVEVVEEGPPSAAGIPQQQVHEAPPRKRRAQRRRKGLSKQKPLPAAPEQPPAGTGQAEEVKRVADEAEAKITAEEAELLREQENIRRELGEDPC